MVGTLTHECGHIIAAQSRGYDTTLHYGSMNYDNSALTAQLDTIYLANEHEIENDLDFDEKEVFEQGMQKLYSDSFLVSIGGPIQTILTGCIGFFILLIRRKKIKVTGMHIGDWLAIFLSLFWLREVFNLLHSVANAAVYGETNYFGGDEMYISEYYNLGSGTIPVVLGLLGAGISFYVIIMIIPVKFRLVFVLSGIIGGSTGFYVWFEILGPLLIP